MRNLKYCWNGAINWNLGQRYKAQFKFNQEYLAPSYMQKFGIDLKDFLTKFNYVSELEEQVNWKTYNEKSFKSYQENYSAHNFMKNVEVPMLVYHIEDDPIICP